MHPCMIVVPFTPFSRILLEKGRKMMVNGIFSPFISLKMRLSPKKLVTLVSVPNWCYDCMFYYE